MVVGLMLVMVSSFEIVVKMKPYTQDRELLFLAIIPYIGFVLPPLPLEVIIATNDLPFLRGFSGNLIDSI